MSVLDVAMDMTPSPAASGIFRKPLILYVEQDYDTRVANTALLRHAGFRVAEATNGVEGVESALELKPDLVLLDLALAIVDGYEAMRRIKRNPKTAHIPIVVLSACLLREEGVPFCDGFLSKSHDASELVRLVNDVRASRAQQVSAFEGRAR